MDTYRNFKFFSSHFHAIWSILLSNSIRLIGQILPTYFFDILILKMGYQLVFYPLEADGITDQRSIHYVCSP